MFPKHYNMDPSFPATEIHLFSCLNFVIFL